MLVNPQKFTEEKKNKIFEKIKSYEPKISIRIASKSVFSLNFQQNSEYISDIFKFIEESKKDYDIEDYTLSSTSLEDVFLKINNNSNLNCMKYNNKRIGSQEILFPENLIEVSSFFTQFISQLKRNILPIKRNKFMLLLEYLSGLGIIFIINFLTEILIIGTTKLNLIDILEENKIYIYEDSSTKEALKDSYAYNTMKITLKSLTKKPNNIQNLIDLAYNESFAHIAMGCISINQIGDKWNTYVTSLNLGNLYADTALLVSSFLKKKFGISAIILNEIELSTYEIKEVRISYIIRYIGILTGYVIFLGGLTNEKIKERKTNIKQLLYLSGSKSWSYWMAFFIIDYLKLFIFSLFLIKYIYFNLENIILLIINFLITNASSIIFLYFISFFGSNAKSGIKFLFILSITFVILLFGIFYFQYALEKNLHFLLFIFFFFSPITSFLFSFVYMAKSFTNYNFNYLEDSFRTSSFIQGINFLFYFLLFVLMETGYLKIFFNWLKLKLCLRENNFNFSEKQLSDEFLIYNNANNSLLLNKNNKQPIKSQEMIIKRNNKIFSNNINTLLLENIVQVKPKEEESYIQNTNCYDEVNKNINQPLIQDGNNDLGINNINDDDTIHSLYNLSLKESNPIYSTRNPDLYKEKIMLDTRNDFTTRIEGLHKTFWLCCKKNVKAINNLNLGLEANERFGLLGLNGSGKTTIFRAITNEILYDYGKISLFGFDTRKQFENIRSKIGYCPQENPLFDFMKVREILQFYSKLKTCFLSIEEICKNLGLTKYLDTYCVNLSGGNKRKLTFAIAIMNKPSLLLLDEPSTGVDPDSRRFMWRNINELSNNGHRYNMILTTHSMDEAEILCDRVSWLKNGSFVCIGNPEELKIKYSLGYKLYIKFDEEIINQNKDMNNIRDDFQDISELIEGFSNYSNYILNDPALEFHIRALKDVIYKLKSNTKSINLIKIRKDLSFELILKIIQERKSILFSDILNMKNYDNKISEIIISLESLDNIMESFI